MSTTRITFLPAAKAALLLIAFSVFCALWAAGGAIGMVMASGTLQVDHARIAGNGTLFDGSMIQTERVSSRIQLNNGSQLRLSADSRATVYERRIVLEQGQGEISSNGGYDVEAGSLRITGSPGDNLVRIRLDSGRRVVVAAVRGPLKVSNSSGVVVADMEAGQALELEPQAAGATAPTQASGCLVERSGRYLLVERTTNVILEVQGADLARQLGNRIEVNGRAEATKPHVTDASQLVTAAGVRLIARGGCTAVAKKVGASVTAAAAAGTAVGAGAAGAGTAGAAAVGVTTGTVAVIGGVAAAATIGGLAAVGDLPGQGPVTPTASR